MTRIGYEVDVTNFLRDVENEYKRARFKHPRALNSLHEAYGVMKEEFDEFWDEVKLQGNERSQFNLHNELTQIAAMCLATVVELVGEPPQVPQKRA